MRREERAPARGHYDRSASREARVAAQRGRLLRAVAEATLTGTRTVGFVLQLAGVGRSTFYEYFDDFEHARAQIQDHVTHSLQRELQSEPVRTGAPDVYIQRSCEIWIELTTTTPWLWASALSDHPAALSRPAQVLRDSWRERLSDATSRHDEELLLQTSFVAAAAQGAGLQIARAACSLEPSTHLDAALVARTLAAHARRSLPLHVGEP